MARERLLDRLLSPQDQERVLQKIEEIESRSSGEVRVHVTDRRVKDALDSARKTFAALGMTRTRRRNGVLVFLSLPSRKLAIVGDEGVDRVAAPEYWQNLARTLSERFAADSYTDGLLEVLRQVEEVLVEHFPYEEGDLDELPDDISFPVPRRRLLPWAVAGALIVAAALLYLSWRLFFTGWS
jgi:uncharacterized membrane protein